MGSPPRVRGKADKKLNDGRAFGITPARAGKSAAAGRGGPVPQDHPRACGEKKYMGYVPKTGTGSPPRVRGKGGEARCGSYGTGITPARAGKRLNRSRF